MPAVLIMKNEAGKLEGFGSRGAKTYERFMRAVRELATGELISFTYKVPRSPKFHKLHFVMLAAVFASQEQFTDEEQFRKWAEVGAGHCDILPGPKGKPVAIPKSIAYDALDDVEFGEVHQAVKSFLRSLHATRFLWPHLSDTEAGNMMAGILEEFER